MMEAKLVRKTAAAALLLIVLMGFARAAYTYISYYQARTARILEQRHALGRLQALVDRSDEIDGLASSHSSDALARLVFEAPSPPLLIAKLQKQLQAIVIANQAQFIRASELPARRELGFTLAGLKLEVTGTIESLARTLEAIEASVPLLIIEEATIAADSINQNLPDRVPQLAMSLAIVAVGQTDNNSTAEPK
jgi:hypothetical protein